MRAAAEACVARGVDHRGPRLLPRPRRVSAGAPSTSPPDRLAADVVEQWEALAAEAAAVGGAVAYVKPHGALYHRMATDPEVAAAVVDALAGRCDVLVAPPASAVTTTARWPPGSGGDRGVLRPRLRRPGSARPPRPRPARWSTTRRRRPTGPGRWPSSAAWPRSTAPGSPSRSRRCASTATTPGPAPGPGPRGPPWPRRAWRSAASPDRVPREPVTTTTPRIVPFGDRALLVRTADVGAAHALAALVDGRRADGTDGGGDEGAGSATDRAPGRIEDVVVGFATVLVVLGPDPATADLDRCADWLGPVARGGDRRDADREVRRSPTSCPVAFDGPDLPRCRRCRADSAGAVVELLVGAELEVAFVGFAPGFPYLTGLPDRARRPPPTGHAPDVGAGRVGRSGRGLRLRLPAVHPGRLAPARPHRRGAVRPRTSARTPGRPPETASASSSPTPRPRRRRRPRPGRRPAGPCSRPSAGPGLEVRRPRAAGPASRTPVGAAWPRAWACPAAGAADPRALAARQPAARERPRRRRRRVHGDRPVAAGRRRRSHRRRRRRRRNGRRLGSTDAPFPTPPWSRCRDGQVVSVGRVRPRAARLRRRRRRARHPARARLPLLATSCPASASARLRAGDRLDRGVPGRVRGRVHLPAAAPRGGAVVLRVLPGPDTLDDEGSARRRFDSLVSIRWRVGPDVDRVGVRLVAADGEAVVRWTGCQLDADGDRCGTAASRRASHRPPALTTPRWAATRWSPVW